MAFITNLHTILFWGLIVAVCWCSLYPDLRRTRGRSAGARPFDLGSLSQNYRPPEYQAGGARRT